MWDTISLFVLVFILAWIYRSGRRPKNMPPGPSTWPIIGNLDTVFSTSRFHVRSQELGKKYNGMYSLQFAKYPGVMITDFNLAKEAFIEKGDIYSDRASHTDYSKMVSAPKDKGVAIQSGEAWKRLKRLTMTSFRDSGVGKSLVEHKIQEEAAEILTEVRKNEGQYFAFDSIFNKATMNVICTVLLCKRYSYDDPLYLKVLDSLNTFFKQAGFRNISNFLPWWTFYILPYVKPGFSKMQESRAFIRKWVVQNIQEHRETFDKENLRDFVDIYLNAEATEEKGLYSDKQLFNTLVDLFTAGAETSSTTLLWAIVYLVKYPEIQRKCRDEIRQKVGDRQLTYKDRSSMPYLDATICEVQRCGNTVPHVIHHRTNRESSLGGYTIPKDTIVNINTYAMHMDASLWADPQAFKPERFLDENGVLFKPQFFVPFGLGRRSCLGEILAKMEIWIFLAELLQKCELEAENIASLPTPRTTDYGLTLIPEQFYVKAIRPT